MTKYRKQIKRFWIDPQVIDLNPEQKLLFSYAITGMEACSNTLGSGIYEISRASFENHLGFTHDKVNEILDFFNEKKPSLLQYDKSNHMIFVKSFYKHNGNYKKGVSGLVEDFNDTYKKAPNFWKEFVERYRKELTKIYVIAQNPEDRQFLERLFDLKNEFNELPALNISSASVKKLTEKENQLIK